MKNRYLKSDLALRGDCMILYKIAYFRLIFG